MSYDFRKVTVSKQPNQYEYIAEHSRHLQSSSLNNESQNTYTINPSLLDYSRPQGIRSGNFQTIDALKQQYEILRNIPVNTQYRKQSNENGSLLSYSLSKKSEYSQSDHFSRSGATKNNQNILLLEKQQLELVVSNSMKKIEELLTKEVQYKTIIHKLEMEREKFMKSNQLEELRNALEKIKKREALLLENKQELESKIQRITAKNTELSEKLRSMERNLKDATDQNSELRYTIDQILSQKNVQKNKISDLEIQCTRLRRETQISIKNYEDQIRRLSKQPAEYSPTNNNQIYAEYQKKLEYEKQRYSYLEAEFKQYQKRQSEEVREQASKEKQMQSSAVWQMLKNVREEANNHRQNSANVLSSTLNKLISSKAEKQSPKNNDKQSEILAEIYALRKEVETLKVPQKSKEKTTKVRKNDDQYLRQIRELKQKLQSYEQKYIKLNTENEDLRKKYQILTNKYDALEIQNELLKTQLQNNSSQLQQLQNLKQQLRDKDNQHEAQYSSLRKKAQGAQFQLKKTIQTAQFERNHLQQRYESQISSLQRQLTKEERDRSMLGQQLKKMKGYYDAKIIEKNQMMEKMRAQYRSILDSNEKALISVTTNNQKDISGLIQKIQEMNSLNERYMSVVARNGNLERQILDIKQMLPRLRGLNENVEHLWTIKETEYSNLNNIIQEVRFAP